MKWIDIHEIDEIDDIEEETIKEEQFPNEIIENEHSNDLYEVLTMVGGFTIKRDS